MSDLGHFEPWDVPPEAPAPGGMKRSRLVLLIVGAALAWKLVVGVALATALGFDLEPVAVSVPGDARPAEAGLGETRFGEVRLGEVRLADAGVTPVAEDPHLEELRGNVTTLERTFERQAPAGRYIVIDRGNNRLWVRSAKGIELEAVVSTGSGTVLKESGGEERTWTFQTPAGRHKVLSKRRNPVWVKPDWAFLEEGQQPPARISDRVEKGSLGEWALDLGDGYMIHGTLYERLLGRSLTHGCIRVGRDDLREVARLARPGTPVIIF